MENFDSKLRNAFQETVNVLNKESFINKTEESFSIGFYLILIYKLGFFNKKIGGKTLIQSIDEWKETDKISFQFAFDRIERQIENLSINAAEEIETIFTQLGQYDSKRYSETIIKELFEEFFVKSKNRHDSFATPFSLGKVIASLTNIEKGSKVFNPFSGNGSLTIALDPEIEVLCIDLNHGIIELLNLRKYAWGKNDNYIILPGDCINHFNRSKKQFDLIVSMPPLLKKFENQVPYLMQYASFIDFVIDSTLMALKESGKAVLILPTNYLSSGNIKDNSRKRILDEDLIDTIINLPPGAAENTSVRFSLLFLNKRKVNPDVIRMVDGNQYILDETKRYPGLNVDLLCMDLESALSTKLKIGYVNLDEIKHQSNNLNPARYLIPKFDKNNRHHILLSSILGVIERKEYPLEALLHHVGLNDLKSNAFDYELNANSLELNFAQYGGTILEEDCLLISALGSSLKPTYFKYEGKPVLASPDIFCFKIDTSKINIDFIIYSLYTESVKKQVTGYRGGSVIKKLHLNDLFKAFIEVPSLEDQSRIYSLLFENDKGVAANIAKLRNENKKLQDEFYAQSAFLRHTIAGPLSNLQGAVDRIQTILKEHVHTRIPNLFEIKAHPNHEMNLGKWLELMRSEVEFVTQIISKKHTHFEEILNEPLYKVDIAAFLTSYVSQLTSNGQFDAKIDIDDQVLLDNDELPRTIYVMATDKLLRHLLDNLVENAVKHAFRGQDNMHIEFCLRLDEAENNLSLDVSNTGYPFPPGFDFNTFWRKGGKAGLSGGDGIGGWMVGQIIDKLELADYEINDEVNGFDALTNTNLATTFWFSFNLVN